jgi:heme-degrading monooxygenase HmoA
MLTATPGVKWAKIGRGVENPGKFIFLVEWDALESHAAFNKSLAHPVFLTLFAPYAQGGAMEHL